MFARFDGKVVLAHFKYRCRSIQAVIQPCAFDAQFVSRAFFRIQRVVVYVLIVLRLENGAVIGIGGEVVGEIVGQPQIGGENAVFFTHPRNVVIAEIVSGSFPASETRSGK